MKHILLIAVVFLSVQFVNAQVEVEGVKVPGKLSIENQELVLNGVGVRSKYFMDLYVGSLFLEVKESNAKNIIDADDSMLMQLDIISGMITSEKMTDAINDGFDNSVKMISEDVSSEIQAFKSVFKEEIVDGDNFQFLYIPASGVHVFKNKAFLKKIEGYPFKKALFAIWLGNEPADKKLKKGMLGN